MTFQCKASIGTSYLTTSSFSAGEDGVRQARRCIQGLGIGARLSYAAAAVGPFQGTTSDTIQPRFGHASDSLTVHRPAPRFYAQGKTSYQGWSLALSFLSPISGPLAAIRDTGLGKNKACWPRRSTAAFIYIRRNLP